MSNPSGIITLITDFGEQDGYVGAIKGVILSLNPDARIVDISHQIARHDVVQAALILCHISSFFPPGSVHLTVVDPGVGGERRALLAETRDFIFIGPDNGVLAPALDISSPLRIVSIENPQFSLPLISDTFHGRDVFAPAAAHCSLGVPVGEFGPPVDDPRIIEITKAERTLDGLRGHVIAVDYFGNLVTDIARGDLESCFGEDPVVIQLRETVIQGISRSYQQVPRGKALAIVGSWEMLEIAVNGDDARRLLGVGRGDPVLVRREISEPANKDH